VKKLILDLCGGTGSWSKPYLESGEYEVLNITLPGNDINEWLPDEPGAVYGILAAPPCTMFSLARTTAKTPRDFNEGMQCVESCLNIIWTCRKESNSVLKFWALENPAGFLRQFLGKPALTFNPCDYGDAYTKKTDIWGYFKEPRKNPVELTDEQRARCAVNTRILPKISGSCADKRAITPQGFAKAFFKANK